MSRCRKWTASKRPAGCAREAERGLLRMPVIAMTANVMTEDRTACLEAGMDDFIAKPFRAEVMTATLLKYA
ncbi:response regulator [Azonexus sp.]|uniref:response regulator n=1 Tax=Azonexus sp. TaxID=1872668 RepID=UPI0035AF2AF9